MESLVGAVARDFMERHGSISSSAEVSNAMADRFGLVVKARQVSTILKEQLDLKYMRLGKGNHVRNCDRSLVLRKQFAAFMLKQIEAGVRVINVDETLIGRSNFKRAEWQVRHSSSVSDQLLI